MSHKDLIRVGWMVVTIQPTTIPWPMFDLPAFLKKNQIGCFGIFVLLYSCSKNILTIMLSLSHELGLYKIVILLMCLFMDFQMILSAEILITLLAVVWFVTSVDSSMSLQMT